MNNPQIILSIADIDRSTPIPKSGETVRIIIGQIEYSDIYETLLEACVLCGNSSASITYTDFSIEDSGKTIRYDRLSNVVLTGIVLDGTALMAALSDAQKLRTDEEVGDAIANVTLVLEEKIWLRDGCPLPSLFKAARVEQLLYWLQWEGTEEDQKPAIALDLIELDPELKEIPIVSQYL